MCLKKIVCFRPCLVCCKMSLLLPFLRLRKLNGETSLTTNVHVVVTNIKFHKKLKEVDKDFEKQIPDIK